MKRRLVNLLTVLSLLVCLAACGVWVRSHWTSDVRRFTRDEPLAGEMPAGPVYYELVSTGGAAQLLAMQGKRERRPMPWLLGRGGIVPPGQFPVSFSRAHDFGPIVFASGTGSMYFGTDLRGPVIAPAVPFRSVAVSFWFPALLAAAAPAWRLARHVRNRPARRAAAGLCVACGYDLRASSGRCPECGAASVTSPV